MTDPTVLRIIILLLGLAWLGWIWWSWQRRDAQATSTRSPRRGGEATRAEPTLGGLDGDAPTRREPDFGLDVELDRLGREIAGKRVGEHGAERLDLVDVEADADRDADAPAARGRERDSVGQRPDGQFERIVAINVLARDGETIAGPELIVAAERSGLVFGDMGIFHRMIDGRAELGPIFSVANMMRPGSFDMASIQELRTSGITFFMTLPGPLRALDAWDTMLPAAQRCAELLDAQLTDEQRNALGRQTIQHLREELRTFDRQHERQTIKRAW